MSFLVQYPATILIAMTFAISLPQLTQGENKNNSSQSVFKTLNNVLTRTPFFSISNTISVL